MTRSTQDAPVRDRISWAAVAGLALLVALGAFYLVLEVQSEDTPPTLAKGSRVGMRDRKRARRRTRPPYRGRPPMQPALAPPRRVAEPPMTAPAMAVRPPPMAPEVEPPEPQEPVRLEDLPKEVRIHVVRLRKDISSRERLIQSYKEDGSRSPQVIEAMEKMVARMRKRLRRMEQHR